MKCIVMSKTRVVLVLSFRLGGHRCVRSHRTVVSSAEDPARHKEFQQEHQADQDRDADRSS